MRQCHFGPIDARYVEIAMGGTLRRAESRQGPSEEGNSVAYANQSRRARVRHRSARSRHEYQDHQGQEIIAWHGCIGSN